MFINNNEQKLLKDIFNTLKITRINHSNQTDENGRDSLFFEEIIW